MSNVLLYYLLEIVATLCKYTYNFFLFNMTVRNAKNKVIVHVVLYKLTFDRNFISIFTNKVICNLLLNIVSSATLFEYILITFLINILAKYEMRQTCSTHRALQLGCYQKLSINYN